jgi:TPP-dependent pyruvate/acetoin dehydrogenase alpha subunit
MTDSATETPLTLYRTMYLIRKTEEILMAEYHPADEMRCPMHFCVGQEAMPAALAMVLRAGDVLMSHYRSHGYYLAKGAPLDAMLAEFYGKAIGANAGVAGSMELASHGHNFYSGAIVGGSLVIPIGSAFAQKYRGGDDISVAVIGDGSLDEGVTYEVFNLAALFQLPLLIICENNHYAAHTSIERRMVNPALAERAKVFGLPTLQLDGNDPELLLQHLEPVMRKLRLGSGPQFIEIETYRQCAHVGPTDDDALAYRPVQEVAHWKTLDPLPRLRRKLTEVITHAELSALESEICARIDAALSTAKRAPFPDFATVLAMNWAGTYSTVVTKFVESGTVEFETGQAEARLGPF